LERTFMCGSSVCTTRLRVARIGDVDAGEVLGRGLVRQPQDAAAVAGELHRHAFAQAAEAGQLVLASSFMLSDRVWSAREAAEVLSMRESGDAYLANDHIGSGRRATACFPQPGHAAPGPRRSDR
jgi:hypothetical protein